jgi:tRNA nucleotidyltransferase (CCA-adding enzyme)
VLRVARFAARYHDRGFGVATETLALMESMVTDGELGTLPPERIWQELSRALSAAQPAEFFRTLRRCGALATIFPELDALFGVPQPQAHHPEGDAGIHTLLVLEQAAGLSTNSKIRFAALVHDLGKGATPPQHWPKHIGHEKRGLKLVGEMCDRLRVPADYRRLALLVTEYHLLMHRLETLRPETVLKLLNRLDAFRNPDRIEEFALACEADARGRGTGLAKDYPSTKLLQTYLQAVTALSFSDLAATATDGRARGREVRKRRLAALGSAQIAWRNTT